MYFGNPTENSTARITREAGTGHLKFGFQSGVGNMILQQSGSVGIGTTAPEGTLHVLTGSAGAMTAHANADDLIVESAGVGGISILNPAASDGNIYFGNPVENNAARITREATTGDLIFGVSAGAERMRIIVAGVVIGATTTTARLTVRGGGANASAITGGRTDAGTYSFSIADAATSRLAIGVGDNAGAITTERVSIMGSGAGVGVVKIAGTATRATTEGTNHLDIFDGTAPVGTLANGISLYSTTGELRVMDAGGTATLLSASDKLILASSDPSWMPWAFPKENPYTGERWEVNMGKLIAWAEMQSGQKFTERKLMTAKLDWDADQDKMRLEQEKQILAAQNQVAESNKQIAAESDPAKKAELMTQRDSIKVPLPYAKKRPPTWMINRGVKTAIVEV